MSNVVKFESAKVPAHLSKFAGLFGGANDALGKSGPSYPVLNIKGKTWSVVEDKVKTKLLTDDGDPLAAVRIVLIKAADGLSKVFYKSGYDEDESAGQKPDCFSHDGVRPDSSVSTPEAKTCAVCPHNAWGSGNNGKGRACSDSKRVAIAAEGALDKPMLLRVPPASLKGLAEYGAMLSKRNTPYQAVVTRVSFDSEASSPKLVFKAVNYLDEDDLQTVATLQTDEIVEAILGKASAAAAPAVEQEEEDDIAPPVKATAGKTAAKAKPEPVEEEEEEIEVAPVKATATKAKPKPETVEEEDEVEAAPVKPTAKAKPAAKVVAADDDLDSLLDGLDLDD